MSIEVNNHEAEVIDHMRHVSYTGRQQIVWRARVIRKAEQHLKDIRGGKTKEGKSY